jgi:hypothetical protein
LRAAEEQHMEEMLILDFCNIRTWTPPDLFSLYQKHLIRHDDRQDNEGELEENVEGYCRTKHDQEHNYALNENDISRSLQKHFPEKYILPSQPEYNRLWDFLRKSQEHYREFLDKCASGILDVTILNNSLREMKEIHPIFFPSFGTDILNRQAKKTMRWNPILSLFEKTCILEDAIDLEIINMILRHRGIIFSKVKRCRYSECQRYFIAIRPKKVSCGDKCRFAYNNEEKKKTGYSKTYQSKHRIKGYYIRAKER